MRDVEETSESVDVLKGRDFRRVENASHHNGLQPLEKSNRPHILCENFSIKWLHIHKVERQ